MGDYLIFALFLIVGAGMLGGGLYYKFKDKDDSGLYNKISAVGAVLAIVAVVFKFVI